MCANSFSALLARAWAGQKTPALRGAHVAGTVNIALMPVSGRYDSDDNRWREQVADLVRDLRVETESLTVKRTPVPGTKGSLDQLILTLGSAGVFTTALDVLRIWLGRDKTRSVDLTYRDREGQEQHFSVTAQHADRETLAPLIAAVAVQIGAGP